MFWIIKWPYPLFLDASDGVFGRADHAALLRLPDLACFELFVVTVQFGWSWFWSFRWHPYA